MEDELGLEGKLSYVWNYSGGLLEKWMEFQTL
jgi:hypothetical protein